MPDRVDEKHPSSEQRRPLGVVTLQIRARLAAGEDLSADVFQSVRSHDGLELNLRVTVRGKKLSLTDADKKWQWTGPLATSSCHRGKGSATIQRRHRFRTGPKCPCCRVINQLADVWYDCLCFHGGGKPGCENCARGRPEQDAHIAATIREWGWDKNPSPGMLDYLTPGWRDARRVSPTTERG